jgi:hypothetical protein
MSTGLSNPKEKSSTRIQRQIFNWLVSYFVGIVACVLCTPVDLILVGSPLWLFYPPFAIIGFFLFYLHLTPNYVFGPTFGYWLVYSLGLILVVAGVALHFGPLRSLRPFSAMLIGFSIGFVGTLGVFYTAAASI